MTAGLAPALALLVLLGAAPEPPAPAPPAAPAAEPIGVQVRLESREVRLGAPFELAIEIRHRLTERYSLPASPAEPFRLLSGSCQVGEGSAAARGEATTTCTLRLALLDLGPHDLPELVLPVETPEGPRELRIPGPAVSGAGILDPAAPPEALALKDLAPPAPLLVWNVPLAIGLLAALLAALAGWLGLRAWRRRALRGAEPSPPLPPHERFARQLDALEAARLPDRGRAAEHVARVSEHVREYLGAVTGQNALDLTTAELLARLSFQPDPRVDLARLASFLEAADLVKFARAPAGATEAAGGSAYARALLARTRPAPSSPTLPSPGTGERGLEPGAAP